ncbi:MAG: 3-methyl-2-oxobutanoate hydroxymethyltransferase [Firmicutes bacterium]|nr:3-methyl-2-oxobutanoate hydroxymethyltransferase [Bacillota bacterium]
MSKTVTLQTLLKMKAAGRKIAMMTAYDYTTASLLSASGMHVLLVGDSLGMVVQGHNSTLPVTLDEMIYHTKMVVRGSDGSMVVADLPFMTYQVSVEDALRSAGRLMSEAGVHAVKLEGGRQIAPTVRRLVDSGVPVMGHIGLTPQSVHALGGFSVQGKTAESARRLIEDALTLQEAGAFAVVLEVVPSQVSQAVTKRLTIPTIGIGAGPQCDGQVLVFHDFVGLTSGYIPKHNKQFAELAPIVRSAASQYIQEVADGTFPGKEQTISLSEDDQKWLSAIQEGDPYATGQ